MNLIDAYRYLAALERHRHFGRAADACHITQPALSNALRALESSSTWFTKPTRSSACALREAWLRSPHLDARCLESNIDEGESRDRAGGRHHA
jgi:hypothetical protein